MKTFSKNKKLNKVLNEIHDQLINICDTRSESISEIKRYMNEFKYHTDYNIYQYGNVLIYYSDIQKMYKRAGYGKWLWSKPIKCEEAYKRQIGYIARKIVKDEVK